MNLLVAFRLFRTLFAFAIVLTAAEAFAECDTEIRETDRVVDVKRKLQCFVSEVRELRKQVEAARQVPPSINMIYGGDKVSLTLKQCLAKADQELKKRGARVVERGDTWIEFALGSAGVMVWCDDSVLLLAVAATTDRAKVSEMSLEIRDAIAPAK